MNKTIYHGVAFLIIIMLTGCHNSGPPKSILDEEIRRRLGDQLSHYEVTNTYNRKPSDETFHIYEFNVTWVSKHPSRQDVEVDQKETIGFVKRGNRWYANDWKN